MVEEISLIGISSEGQKIGVKFFLVVRQVGNHLRASLLREKNH